MNYGIIVEPARVIDRRFPVWGKITRNYVCIW